MFSSWTLSSKNEQEELMKELLCSDVVRSSLQPLTQRWVSKQKSIIHHVCTHIASHLNECNGKRKKWGCIKLRSFSTFCHYKISHKFTKKYMKNQVVMHFYVRWIQQSLMTRFFVQRFLLILQTCLKYFLLNTKKRISMKPLNAIFLSTWRVFTEINLGKYSQPSLHRIFFGGDRESWEVLR